MMALEVHLASFQMISIADIDILVALVHDMVRKTFVVTGTKASVCKRHSSHVIYMEDHWVCPSSAELHVDAAI